MKKLHYSIALAAAIAAPNVFGGATSPITVVVDMDNNFAQGDMVTARYSKNGDELIGCGIRSFEGFAFGFCQASDADGNFINCSTQDPELLATIRGVSDFSYIQFRWNNNPDGSVTCAAIGASTQSFYLPRNLGSNDKPGNDDKSGK